MSKPSTRRETRCLALSSVLSALSVILLYFGSIVELLDLTMVVVASLIVSFAVLEMRGRYPVMIWGVTSVLALLLLPNKFGALCYFGLCGFYPMLKPRLHRLPRILSVLIKLVFFNLILSAILALSLFVLHMPAEELGYTWALYALGNIAFFLYDFALTRLTLFYYIRLRRFLKVGKYLGE